MRIFVNIYLYLQFQCHFLKELDGRTQCDHYGENVMKIGWLVLEIFNVFSVFDIFHLENGD